MRESPKRQAARVRGSARAGFSYVELVTVLAILAIVAALAAPRMASSMSNRRADLAARQIASDLESARRWAMTHSTSQQFLVLASMIPGYTLPGLENPDHAGQVYTVYYFPNSWGMTFESVDLGHDSDTNRLMIEFDMYGKPDSGGSIVISIGGHRRTITVDDDTGLVTIQ
ncbi:MAG: prepilin-type N-terminal cleavage/methylation domain-containing protein [Phycisphaerales bacterium]